MEVRGVEAILLGPGNVVEFGFSINVENTTFTDDELSDDEMDMICGTDHVRTGESYESSDSDSDAD